MIAIHHTRNDAIPMQGYALAIIYNLPKKDTIRLTKSNLKAIFEKNIEKWNSPELILNNQGLSAINKSIIVVRLCNVRFVRFLIASGDNLPLRGHFVATKRGEKINEEIEKS